jgi:hypothetical protein
VLAAAMPTETLEVWGWSIPFLLGLVVGLAGFALRRGIQEEVIGKKAGRSPLLDTLRHHGPLLLRLAALSVFNSVSFYLMFVPIAVFAGVHSRTETPVSLRFSLTAVRGRSRPTTA